ncbi:MAG: hypothetical protein JW741_29595, partial [Sedimentisphaerales bacterium]|nr:hypothetical protein [Sedimentisphaerales bacterium]
MIVTKYAFFSAVLILATSVDVSFAAETLSDERILAPADAGTSGFYPGGKDAYYPGAAFGPSTPSTGSVQAGSGQGKDTYLIAWQAGRMNEGDIVGCRVDKGGKVLDEKPFVISTAKDDQERPKVAFGKDVFLTVWQDLRNEKDYDVFGARVTPEGKVLDPEGILISGGRHNQCKPRLAFDGENFLVAWMDFRDGKSYQVFAARVSADGKLLDPEGVNVFKGGVEPAVASSGGGRALVTMFIAPGPARDGFGGIFLQDGKPAGRQVAPILPGAKPDYSPSCPPHYRSAAAGKNGYLLVAQNYAPAGRSGVGYANTHVCLIVRPDGAREPLQTLTGTLHRILYPDVVWDGSCYLATWTDITANAGGGDDPHEGIFSRVYAIRLDENGRLITPAGQQPPEVSEKQSKGQRLFMFTPPGQPTLISGTMDNPAQR